MAPRSRAGKTGAGDAAGYSGGPVVTVGGATQLLVVITPGQSVCGTDTTRRSLALQAGVDCEVVLAGKADVAVLCATIDASRAPFVTFLQDGDVLCPGALRTMCDALSNHGSDTVAVEALALPIDGRGTSREGAHAQAETILARARTERSYRRSAAHGALLTVRRQAHLPPLVGTSVDQALRQMVDTLSASGRVRRVVRIVCARPTHGVRRATGMSRMALVDQLAPAWRYRLRHMLRSAHAVHLVGPLLRLSHPYEAFRALLRGWPNQGLRQTPRVTADHTGERIAYILWRYPYFTETFIQREVQALRGAGVPLEVFALEPDDPPVPHDPDSPLGSVVYFGPADVAVGRAAIRRHLTRRPWTVVCLWCFVVAHRISGYPSWWRDRDILYLAAQVASALAARGITHVHAPWANRYAAVAFIASRLIGVTFTVQARASEVHRTVQVPLVADRLKFATFIITNSRYNERDLAARLAPVGAPPVHVVYNGIDLSRFRPPTRADRSGYRLLSVGRLVEPKGFRHLLYACRALRDRGMNVSCEIIGGPSEPTDTAAWVELRMLLTSLQLESVVTFQGSQSFSSVLRAFERADIFVLPCVRGRDGSHDITPNSLIEAMAMALPVVSTTSGAIPEIVDHEVDGLLVPPGDSDALADALERLVRDGELRESLGVAARRKVEHRFDAGKNVGRRVELFDSLRRSLAGQPGQTEVQQPSARRADTTS
jgi:colanic acid/amylovoran biosynthesis glycosyltransferase